MASPLPSQRQTGKRLEHPRDWPAVEDLFQRSSPHFYRQTMFQLTRHEKGGVVTNRDHLRKLEYSLNLFFAFAEYGAVMLASVLDSPIGVQASTAVVRAFIRLRKILARHKELARKTVEREGHDEEITALFDAIRGPHRRLRFRWQPL